ncbi:hypothetical protein ACG1BZ_04940 [Microbulbifer sp. CNSA002]
MLIFLQGNFSLLFRADAGRTESINYVPSMPDSLHSGLFGR